MIDLDTRRPDNGGVSGTGYSTMTAFDRQLPGPFYTRACTAFAATGGSLNIA